jgi:hypothetical protein
VAISSECARTLSSQNISIEDAHLAYIERNETMAEERHENQTKSTGLGLGVNLDVDLKLGELRNTLDMLTDALKQTGDKATDMISGAIAKFREAGVGNLRQAAQQQEGGEQSQLYDRIVNNLRTAAERGESEARNLLKEMGEGVESAGQKMQGAAESEERTH